MDFFSAVFYVAKTALYLENCIHICQIQDNDTPVPSQSERDKTVAGNEGGSVRPTVGVQLPWCQHMLTIWQIPFVFRGVEDK